ncbi:unnamed protein product, partial [Rotaria socialis]
MGVVNTAQRLSVGAISVARRLSSGNVNQPKRMPSLSDDDERHNIPSIASEVQTEAFKDLLVGAALCNNAE